MAIVIGYSEQKYYKLYNLKQKKIVWSRDPTILEGEFLKNQSNLANQELGIKAIENRYAKKRSTKQAVNLIKKIARNTGKSTSLSTSKSASKSTKQTTSKEAAIVADPSYKIEIQIPSYKSTKDSEDIYTISNTLLGDFIKTIIND
jgi:hypothetical protein